MKKFVFAAAALSLVAACSGEATDEAGADGAAAASGDGVSLKAGEWEMTVSAMGQETVTKRCITEEMANSGGFVSGDLPEGCEGDGVSMEDGKISGEFVCTNGGIETKMAMNGTFSEDSYDMTTTTEVAGQTIESKVSGKHVGDCAA